MLSWLFVRQQEIRIKSFNEPWNRSCFQFILIFQIEICCTRSTLLLIMMIQWILIILLVVQHVPTFKFTHFKIGIIIWSDVHGWLRVVIILGYFLLFLTRKSWFNTYWILSDFTVFVNDVLKCSVAGLLLIPWHMLRINDSR